MSMSFHLQNVNRSFGRIASWYTEFMRRTEISFKTQERRIKRLEAQLERHQAGPPSDEQVERVLRKILAEKFAGPSSQPTPTTPKDHFFVQDPKEMMFPKPIPVDPANLFVDPDAVPSRAYAETFQLLENGLRHFPNGNRCDPDEYDEYAEEDDEAKDVKMNMTDAKRPRFSNSV